MINPSLTNSVNVNKVSFKIGTRFTKLDANGKDLANDATSWTCVRDNEQQLIWEVKTNDGSIHDQFTFYRWGGDGAEGRPDPDDLNTDFTHYYWDWNNLLLPSNRDSFCGLSNWRVPSIPELAYFNDGSNYPIDTNYFPHASWATFWSSNKVSYDSAWARRFDKGYSKNLLRSQGSIRVRLVHNIPKP